MSRMFQRFLPDMVAVTGVVGADDGVVGKNTDRLLEKIATSVGRPGHVSYPPRH